MINEPYIFPIVKSDLSIRLCNLLWLNAGIMNIQSLKESIDGIDIYLLDQILKNRYQQNEKILTLDVEMVEI
ncbi:MAG: hypothetical protein COB01_09230 [Lutibacter sp.]|nr:MAG: hypothetical protein COB01_09230 [Lutibacter sp.]